MKKMTISLAVNPTKVILAIKPVKVMKAIKAIKVIKVIKAIQGMNVSIRGMNVLNFIFCLGLIASPAVYAATEGSKAEGPKNVKSLQNVKSVQKVKSAENIKNEQNVKSTQNIKSEQNLQNAKNGNSSQPQNFTSNKTNFLFVQTAPEATIKKISENKYQITLMQPGAYVTYFTDRPTRKAGLLALQHFLNNWDKQGENYFKDNAPNAFLHGVYSGLSDDNKHKSMVFELYEPNYNEKTEILTYQAKPLAGSEMPNIKDTVSVKNISIFIDGGPCEGCL